VTDSALRELAGNPSSRKRFFKMLGGPGAVGAATALLAACGDDNHNSAARAAAVTKTTEDNTSDLKIVNYALTLEYLEAAFYQEVLDSGVIKDRKIGDLAKSIHEHEQEHVDALTATAKSLGGTPAARPDMTFQGVIDKGTENVLRTAATVENLGAAAYLGQAGNIRSKDILAAALSIHSVEARHAAALNELVGRGFGDGNSGLEGSLPDGPFAKPMDMAAVLNAVERFIAG
jgi:rubrerythrin